MAKYTNSLCDHNIVLLHTKEYMDKTRPKATSRSVVDRFCNIGFDRCFLF